MRTLKIIAILFLTFQTCKAQDIIYKRDGTKITAQIIGKIKGRAVTYKDLNELHPPIRTIRRGDIAKIEYNRGRGKIEIFNSDSSSYLTSKTQQYQRGLYLGVCAVGQNLTFTGNYSPEKLSPKWVSPGYGIEVAYEWKVKNNSVTLNAGFEYASCGQQGIYSDVTVKTTVIPVKIGFKILSRKYFYIQPMIGAIHISTSTDDFNNNGKSEFIPVAACELGVQFKKVTVGASFNQLVNVSGAANADITGNFFTLRAGINLF
jgi:hypothetical protein